MEFDVSVFFSALSSPAYIKGAGIALLLTILAHSLAIVISLPMAVVMLGTSKVGRSLVRTYVVIFRAIPVLLLLLLLWNGLPQVNPIFRESWFSPFLAALIGLAIIEAAYQVEINRSALGAIHDGQMDAGRALGLSPTKIFFLVKFPQALRIALPPTVNEFITILKSTSLATVISLRELMTVSQQAVAFSYKYAEYYSAALVYYVVMVMVLMALQVAIEKKMTWLSS